VLFNNSSFRSFKKGELLASKGAYCEHVFLIRKGIVRTYVLTPESGEKTTRLAKEGEFTSCIASFIQGKPATEYLEAVEDCKVIACNSKKLEELSQTNIRISRLMYEGLKETLSDVADRVEFFTIYTPEQRYKKIMEESPELIQRVPQKYLASFLGITTVSLSRIRNRKSL
jgi:CRP-like cAMP-binding protein